MYPNLILADLIIESQFLTWPLSKENYGNRYANNLTRIKFNEEWSGKHIEYEGVKYKTYRDFLHFASDYSDLFCFSDKYDSLLRCPSSDIQLDYLLLHKENPDKYLYKFNELKSVSML